MNLGIWDIDDVVTFTVNTHSPTTTAPADADAPPTYRVYEDETGTPILTGSMALLDDANTVGFYSEAITLSAANGFEAGKSYSIRILGAVGGISGVTIRTLQVGPLAVEVDSFSANGSTEAENAVTAALVAADLATEAEIAAAVLAAADADPILSQLGDVAHGGVAASLQLATLDVVSADYVNMTVSDTLTVVTNEIPWPAAWSAAWGASVIGNGRTRDYFLQGGANAIAFAADGLTFTVYSTDDLTPLYTGTATRHLANVGGLRSVDPT